MGVPASESAPGSVLQPRIPQITSVDQRIIIVCDQGYSSSLAAATMRQLGMLRATDLMGGFQALLLAGHSLTGGETQPTYTAGSHRPV